MALVIEITTGSGAVFTGVNYQEVLWKLYQSFNAFETEDVDYVIRADQRGQRSYPLTFNYWAYMGAIADRLFRAMRISITTTDIDMFFEELLRTGVLRRISRVTYPARTWPVEQAFGPLRPVRFGPENLPSDPEERNAIVLPFTMVDWAVIRGGLGNVNEPAWARDEANVMHTHLSDSRATTGNDVPVQPPVVPPVPEPVTPPIDVAINSGVIGVDDLPVEVEQIPIDVQALIDAGARPVFQPGGHSIALQTTDGIIIELTPEQVNQAAMLAGVEQQVAEIEGTYDPNQLTDEQREEVKEKVMQAIDSVEQEKPRIASTRKSKAS